MTAMYLSMANGPTTSKTHPSPLPRRRPKSSSASRHRRRLPRRLAPARSRKPYGFLDTGAGEMAPMSGRLVAGSNHLRPILISSHHIGRPVTMATPFALASGRKKAFSPQPQRRCLLPNHRRPPCMKSSSNAPRAITSGLGAIGIGMKVGTFGLPAVGSFLLGAMPST